MRQRETRRAGVRKLGAGEVSRGLSLAAWSEVER